MGDRLGGGQEQRWRVWSEVIGEQVIGGDDMSYNGRGGHRKWWLD